MRRQSGIKHIHTPDLFTRKRQIPPQVTIHPRQEETSAHIREKPNRRLRHGEHCSFGGDADGCVDAQPHASAHGDSVHVGNVRFLICGDEVVEVVF